MEEDPFSAESEIINININDTTTLWTQFQESSSSSPSPNVSSSEPMLPAYIAYTSFVLFRYDSFLKTWHIYFARLYIKQITSK